MPTTLNEAVTRVRKIIGEKTPSLWTNEDIKEFYKEGMRRIKSGNKLFSGLEIPVDDTTAYNIPDDFINIPDLFSASRCFEQDKQHYEAGNKMNEFETKRLEMYEWVEDDPENRAILPPGETLADITNSEYITDNYSDGRYGKTQGWYIDSDE